MEITADFIGVSADTTVKNYPVGTNTWRISGDGCTREPYYEAQLTLTACNDSQFICDNGFCVDMKTRYIFRNI